MLSRHSFVNWLSSLGSNQVHGDQNPRYNHYTTGHFLKTSQLDACSLYTSSSISAYSSRLGSNQHHPRIVGSALPLSYLAFCFTLDQLTKNLFFDYGGTIYSLTQISFIDEGKKWSSRWDSNPLLRFRRAGVFQVAYEKFQIKGQKLAMSSLLNT